MYKAAHEHASPNLISEPMTIDDITPIPAGLSELLAASIQDLLLIHLEDLQANSTGYTLTELRYVSGGRLGNRSYFRFHVSGKAERPAGVETFDLALSFAVDTKLNNGRY